MSIEIRPACASDAERIAELSTQLGYPSSPEQVRARLAQLPQDATHAVCVAADESGRAVGWVHVFRLLVTEQDPVAEIAGLVVDAEWRGSGVGKLLMQRAEDWARANGLRMVVLRSNVIRSEAHAFYESIGYTRFKTQHAFRKQL